MKVYKVDDGRWHLPLRFESLALVLALVVLSLLLLI